MNILTMLDASILFGTVLIVVDVVFLGIVAKIVHHTMPKDDTEQ